MTLQRAPEAERWEECARGYRVILDGVHIGQVARSHRFPGRWRYGAFPGYVKDTRAAAVAELVRLFKAAKKHVESMCPACGGTGRRVERSELLELRR